MKSILIVALILCVVASSFAVAEDRQLQIAPEDHQLLDILVEREVEERGPKSALLMGLRLKLQVPMIESADKKLIDDLVKDQQKRLAKPGADTEREEMILDLLVALQLRIRVSCQSARKKDDAVFGGSVPGFEVATCYGPIRTGSITVIGNGNEASIVASRLLERAKQQRDEEFDRAMTAQTNCRRTPCIGERPGGCCASGSKTATKPFCNCPQHRAAVLRLYGPAADPARYPCKCPQPCPGCSGNMVYLTR